MSNIDLKKQEQLILDLGLYVVENYFYDFKDCFDFIDKSDEEIKQYFINKITDGGLEDAVWFLTEGRESFLKKSATIELDEKIKGLTYEIHDIELEGYGSTYVFNFFGDEVAIVVTSVCSNKEEAYVIPFKIKEVVTYKYEFDYSKLDKDE